MKVKLNPTTPVNKKLSNYCRGEVFRYGGSLYLRGHFQGDIAYGVCLKTGEIYELRTFTDLPPVSCPNAVVYESDPNP